MRRRALAPLVVALLVVLAGCGSAADESPSATGPNRSVGSGTPGVSASPTASPTPTPGVDDVALPPGVTAAGVANRSALLRTHASALEGQSLTVSMEFVLEVNGSGRNVSFTGKITPGDDRGWIRVNLPDGTGTYYTEGDTTYKKVRTGGETRYGTTDKVSAIPSKPRFGADLRIRDAIAAANWTATGIVERDGERLVRFEASNVTLPDSVTIDEVTDVDSRGVLLVDLDGVVHRVTVYTAVQTADGGKVVYEIDVRLTAIGSTTVSRPAWVKKAS